MRKIAMIVVVCFLVTSCAPAYMIDRGGNYGGNIRPTERWGYGGKIEVKNSSKSDWLWPVVVIVGTLTIGWLGWKVYKLFQNQPASQQPPSSQQQNQLPPWQDQNRQAPAPATYNVAPPF